MLYQQSSQYDQFQCVGAACEDTCCSGWQIGVDRKTYEKYQECSHPVLRPQLEEWVQIQPIGREGGSFARIALKGSSCPFLSKNLCSIQAELGEGHLSKTCATFPRIVNNAAGVVERSLDLSCPEAARLCLMDSSTASFLQVAPPRDGLFDAAPHFEKSNADFWQIRSVILSMLQNRRIPVAKRLILVGHICEKLDELTVSGNEGAIPQALEGFVVGINAGLYDAHLQGCSANPNDQLSIVLELMVARIKLDFTPQRYLDLYKQFAEGLQLQSGLTVHDCAHRYSQAHAQHYGPFIAAHEHILEHYLVYYAYRTQFPFGSKALNESLESERQFGAYTRQYMLIVSYFAIIRAMMIGLAAHFGSDFGVDHAIRCIQSSSRTLEHCTSYPMQVLKTLSCNGIANVAGLSVLTQDPER